MLTRAAKAREPMNRPRTAPNNALDFTIFNARGFLAKHQSHHDNIYETDRAILSKKNSLACNRIADTDEIEATELMEHCKVRRQTQAQINLENEEMAAVKQFVHEHEQINAISARRRDDLQSAALAADAANIQTDASCTVK